MPEPTASRSRPSDAERLAIAVGRVIFGTTLFLGIVGLLRTIGAEGTQVVAVFLVHPLTAIAWTVLGLVGVAMGVTGARARIYLIGAGALLVAWAVLGLALDGSPSEFLTGDRETVALNLVLGILALGASLLRTPSRLMRALDETAPGESP